VSVLEKLERDRLSAELVSIDRLMASLTADDVVMRYDLEDRREEVLAAIDQAPEDNQTTATAALFFGGRPVVASLGIEAEFGGTVVSKFQDLVAKLMVQDAGLGQRGPVPNKAAAAMHITNVVRGSFGFLMQELRSQNQLVPTELSFAVDSATKLMTAFGSSNEQQFRDIVTDVDQRALATAGEFFSYLRQSGATFRLVAAEQDRAFSASDIAIAADRALSTDVDESNELVYGYLSGTLPESHAFEFRGDDGTLYSGKVDRSIPSSDLTNWNLSRLNTHMGINLKVRRVRRSGEIVRENFTLLGIIDDQQSARIEQTL
jgi:hypothetical protein